MVILLLMLVLVLIGGSIGGVLVYSLANNRAAATNATTPTGAQAGTRSATSSPSTPSIALDPYTHTGTLVLSDPLQGNGPNTDWMTGTNSNNATCAFVGGAYQSSQPVDGDFHACFALATDYRNFVYEVQMAIVAGYAGGIIFRGNQSNSTFYYFRVGQDGSYDLRLYVDPQISDSHLLASGTSSVIDVGINQPNLIAVAANGSTLIFYINHQLVNHQLVNHQLVTSANDSTFTHGQIGVVAYNQGGVATVVYNNVRVWMLP